MQFINNKISFYTIDFDYTNYLYTIDNQVYFNPNYINETKPYIGIIVNVKNLKYFIPLTSAKTKHSKQRLKTNNYIAIFETVDITTNKKGAIYKQMPNSTTEKYHLLSVLDIRKMIPVPKNCYQKIDIPSLDIKQQYLLFKELSFCKQYQKEIIARVNKLYSKTEKKGKALSDFHCDYLKLENAMKFYNKNST